ncbi:MAG: hypothetical protein ACHQ53_19470, partial [Polyangiales bacterium]
MRSWAFTRALLAWLALPLLWVLFELPGWLLPPPWRPSAELPLMLAAWLAALRAPVRWRRPVHFLISFYAAVLLLARIDTVVFVRFMGQEPLLYDQLFMLRHLFVLLSDLWSPTTAAVVFGVSVALVACVALAGLLLRSARGWLEPRASVARGLAIVLCALAL